MSDELVATVIDNGTGDIKAGFGGENIPRALRRTYVVRPKHGDGQPGTTYAREELLNNLVNVDVLYPIENGIITNWENMEKIWYEVCHHDLGINPEEHPVIMTEASFNPKYARAKATEVLFESMKFPAMYLGNQNVFSLYAVGCTTGIALNCGDGDVSVIPVYDGFTIESAVMRMNFAGRDLTKFLMKLLGERGYAPINMELARDIKEKHCYIANDYASETALEVNYTLPDGQVIAIDGERFRCTEGLFEPSLMGFEQQGIHQMLYKSIMKCDITIRKDLFHNIQLGGGTVRCRNFAERLHKEMARLVPCNMDFKFVTGPDMYHNSWIGGSILSSLSSFRDMWISKQEYDEHGPSIVDKKCHPI